jgi:hypothetical protein
MSERMKVASDALLSVLRSCSYPNCTLYLIWHYMSRGQIDLAQSEYARDSDKLVSSIRRMVGDLLTDNAEGEKGQ